MATAAQNYLAAVRTVLEHIETTQLEVIDQAAVLIADSLLAGGAVWCGDIGHGNEGDFINRAGGLACLHKFSFGFNLPQPIAKALADRPRPEPIDEEQETIAAQLRLSKLRAGDVLLISSVSGRNIRPVAIVQEARKLGVKVIVLTSATYTAQVTSYHPSGQKLIDVGDLVFDIGVPYGDAAVSIPGYEPDLLPLSGVSMIVMGWCLWGRVMEIMAERGTPASVFMSFNRDGGPAFYDAQAARYHELGY